MIKIYTDGACRGNHQRSNIGAWGVYCIYGKYEKRVSGVEKDTTNNRMEMQSVIEALKMLKRFDLRVAIHTDSNYVYNGVTKWSKGWKESNWKKKDGADILNKEQWITLTDLISKFKNIHFYKVEGHVDKGNIEADRLCNVAMDRVEKGVN